MNNMMMNELFVLHAEVNCASEQKEKVVAVEKTAVSIPNILDRWVEALRQIRFAPMRPEWIQVQNEQRV